MMNSPPGIHSMFGGCVLPNDACEGFIADRSFIVRAPVLLSSPFTGEVARSAGGEDCGVYRSTLPNCCENRVAYAIEALINLVIPKAERLKTRSRETAIPLC